MGLDCPRPVRRGHRVLLLPAAFPAVPEHGGFGVQGLLCAAPHLAGPGPPGTPRGWQRNLRLLRPAPSRPGVLPHAALQPALGRGECQVGVRELHCTALPECPPALPCPPQAFLEWSPLFYGFYPKRPHLAVAYLCCTFAVGLVSLLLILHRSAPGPPNRAPNPPTLASP